MGMELINGAAFLIFFLVSSRFSVAQPHRYVAGDLIPLFSNVIRPFHNPSETYHYYDLPYCRPPGEVKWKKETLGEVLRGHRLISSPYTVNFLENRKKARLCSMALNRQQIRLFRNAIENDYCFQMQLDDLPFWGFVGRVEHLTAERNPKDPIKYHLFTHIDLTISHKENSVIEVSAFGDPVSAIDVTEASDLNAEFTYSVTWNESSKYPYQRMERYSKAATLPSRAKIHRFSLVNSIAVLLLSIGLLGFMISDRSNKDYNEPDEDPEGKNGFRCPKNLKLFCAVLGTGTHLLATVLSLFVLSFLGYNHVSSSVLSYAITSFIGGYSATSFYCKFAEIGWPSVIFLTGILFSGPFFVVVFTLNAIAVFYNSTMAIPFTTWVVLLTIHLFLTLPMLALGGVTGYCFRTVFTSHSKRSPRENTAPFRRKEAAAAHVFFGGVLPFLAFICEFHYLCATIWGYKVYTSPAIMFVSFATFVFVNALVSVGFSYRQVTGGEDGWWWRCVIRGGSPAVLMYCYCGVFFARSEMKGLLQMGFFFGYSACLCFAVFLMLASVGFLSSFVVVFRICDAAKRE